MTVHPLVASAGAFDVGPPVAPRTVRFADHLTGREPGDTVTADLAYQPRRIPQDKGIVETVVEGAGAGHEVRERIHAHEPAKGGVVLADAEVAKGAFVVLLLTDEAQTFPSVREWRTKGLVVRPAHDALSLIRCQHHTDGSQVVGDGVFPAKAEGGGCRAVTAADPHA